MLCVSARIAYLPNTISFLALQHCLSNRSIEVVCAAPDVRASESQDLPRSLLTAELLRLTWPTVTSTWS